MQELANIESSNRIKDLIYTVRGVKVMLDSDLADIYGYTTKTLNQQVKNNIAKFDDDFRFGFYITIGNCCSIIARRDSQSN